LHPTKALSRINLGLCDRHFGDASALPCVYLFRHPANLSQYDHFKYNTSLRLCISNKSTIFAGNNLIGIKSESSPNQVWI